MTDWWDEQAVTLDAARHAVWGEDPAAWDEDVARCVDAIAPHLRVRPGDIVVDLGCGIGRLAIPIAHRYPDAIVVGVDTSTRMLAHARAAALDLRNLIVWLGDGSMLPVDDESADGVYSVVTFQHLPPPTIESYLDEIERALRPGGLFRFQFVHGDHHRPLDHAYPADRMADAVITAGLDVLTVESGLLFDEWTWITGRKP